MLVVSLMLLVSVKADAEERVLTEQELWNEQYCVNLSMMSLRVFDLMRDGTEEEEVETIHDNELTFIAKSMPEEVVEVVREDLEMVRRNVFDQTIPETMTRRKWFDSRRAACLKNALYEGKRLNVPTLDEIPDPS